MTSTSELPNAKETATTGNRRLIILAIAGVLVGLLVGWLTIGLITGNLPFGPYAYRGIVLPSPEPLGDFTLTTHNGDKASLSDFGEEIVLLYFGYTYCPDVCPTTLATLGQALDALKPAEREQVQVLMVSVDPERDTPQVLADYLSHFDPTFLGLTGTEEEINRATEVAGVYYQKGPGSVEAGYMVDHTATVSVLDRQGRLRLLYSFGTPAEDIAADLRHLIREE